MPIPCLRSAVAALAVSLAGAAAADAPTVEITYEPEARQVTIVVPQAEGAAAAAAPDWLDPVAVNGATRYVGTLPEISEADPSRGAADTGAFLIGALDWLPETDGAPREILLRVPATHRALATGDLMDEAIAADLYTARFIPAAGLRQASLFFGPYSVGQAETAASAGGITLRTYFNAPDAALAADYLDAVKRYVTRYDRQIGAYPYAGFAVVSAPIPVGYGFAGMTYVGAEILGHPYMLGRSLAHEVLHSWWGGGVAVDHAAGNWAEGLTTYQADHALAAERDPEAAREMRRDWLAALSSLPAEADRPLREFVSAGHGRDQSVGYGKAAMLFHMLRRDLGAAAFDAGLGRFWRDRRGAVADWADLRAAFEAETGRDLAPFFDQWLDRAGLPEIRPVSAESVPHGGGHALTIGLAQSGIEGGGPYAVNVPVVIETGAGPRTETIRLDGPSVSATLLLDAPASAIVVDPGFDVARRLADGEVPPTLRDLFRAEAPALLIGQDAGAAAEALAGALFRAPDDLTRAAVTGAVPDADALIVVGDTAEVADLRAARLADAAPAVARQGKARAWVERDGEGRVWLFASADDPDSLADDLASLRFYAAESFVVVGEATRPASGRWPVADNPMRLTVR